MQVIEIQTLLERDGRLTRPAIDTISRPAFARLMCVKPEIRDRGAGSCFRRRKWLPMLGDAIPTETARQVHDALVNGQIMLIDFREPAEFAVERIGGAVLCPLSTFDPLRLPLEVGKTIIFQCGSGKRSEHAYARAVQAGLSVRGHMGGGIGAWKAAGLPTLTVDSATGAVQHRK